MNVDWAALSHYIPEAVLVVIFMFYEERRQIEQDKKDIARDIVWRDFLTEERGERHRSSDQLSTILASLVTGAQSTHELVSRHDEWERQVTERRRATD